MNQMAGDGLPEKNPNAATHFDIHGQKNYDPDYAAASRAIVCLELVK